MPVSIAAAAYLAKVFQALSNPHRLKIFMALTRCCRREQACAVDEHACVGDHAAGGGETA